jgi:hypothetical protein
MVPPIRDDEVIQLSGGEDPGECAAASGGGEGGGAPSSLRLLLCPVVGRRNLGPVPRRLRRQAGKRKLTQRGHDAGAAAQPIRLSV